ncbi:MAG: major facilitator family transporter [Gammaproteobacteria bacterium]|jgi:MFS family permease|nr:major facilitator family transporter [Gammaproteobacteria bacterium]
MSTGSHHSSQKLKAWIICLTASLGLFFIFFQMHAFNSLSNDLMNSFNMSASELGMFSTVYLLAGGLSLIPVSFLIDRFSIKKAIVFGMILAIASSSLFASSHSILLAGLARVLGGISQSFVFLGCLRLVAKWLEGQLALGNSIVITIGLFGAIAAQTPLTLLIQNFGWRYALWIITLLTVAVTALIIFVVKDKKEKNQVNEDSWSDLGSKLKKATTFSQNWLCASYTTFLNLPVIVLGGLLGNIYLQGAEKLNTVQASSIVSTLYIGSMIGGPIIGWMSDKMGRRKPLMFVCPVVGIVIVALICLVPNLSLAYLSALFFILGLFSSAQALAYPILTECNLSRIASVSLGFACAISIIMNAILQSSFASLIKSDIWNELALSPLDPYRSTMMLFAFIFLVGFIISLFIKETFCKIAGK